MDSSKDNALIQILTVTCGQKYSRERVFSGGTCQTVCGQTELAQQRSNEIQPGSALNQRDHMDRMHKAQLMQSGAILRVFHSSQTWKIRSRENHCDSIRCHPIGISSTDRVQHRSIGETTGQVAHKNDEIHVRQSFGSLGQRKSSCSVQSNGETNSFGAGQLQESIAEQSLSTLTFTNNQHTKRSVPSQRRSAHSRRIQGDWWQCATAHTRLVCAMW
mmetsp:Transcript_20928/g.53008  ORF Transcript_20928/g.53008 Transcript_20928/m.53008 type:complete len:217 (-) Transcript_20928:25-675(-)